MLESPERRRIQGRMCDHHWEGRFVFHQCYRQNLEDAI